MADKAKDAQQDEAEGKGGGKLKLILFVVLGLLVLGGGGGGAAWYFGLLGGGEAAAKGEEAKAEAKGSEKAKAEDKGAEEAPKAAKDSAKAAAEEEAEAAAEGVYFVDLPDILVNLRSSGRRMRYLKLKAVLEVGDGEAASAVRRLTPRVMDSIQLYLRALTVEDVRGAIGMEKLKEEMLARINRAIRPYRVEDVLFKEMLVQ